MHKRAVKDVLKIVTDFVCYGGLIVMPKKKVYFGIIFLHIKYGQKQIFLRAE